MFKSVLVLLDGSACAEQALPLATRIANASGGAARASNLVDFEAAKGRRTDLIIVASQAASHIKKWWQGSEAQKAARASPVLVLHSRRSLSSIADTGGTSHLYPLTVAVALDGSRQAELAIVPAAQLVAGLAGQEQGLLHLVRVVRRPEVEALLSGPIDSLQRKQTVDEAMDYLSALSEAVRANLELDLAISWSLGINHDVANSLIRITEHGVADGGTLPLGGSDILALAAHGRCGRQDGALSRVTQRTLDHTRLPLLIVPPR
jgi:nucleotide-binding universal stress UspA family protein